MRVIIVECVAGTKVATFAVEDPCPTDQKMVATLTDLATMTDLSNFASGFTLTPSEAAEVWGIAFASVLFCWLAAKGIGIVVKAIKQF